MIARAAGSGIGIATRFFAVGALCPLAEGGLGAVCAQALPNPALRQRALALLREGIAAPEAVAMAIATDEGRDHRQLHLVDRHGETAAFTGGALARAPRRRGRLGRGQHAGRAGGGRAHARALAGGGLDLPLVERLLAALDAGEAAGWATSAGGSRRRC